ncbi:MAG: acyl-CoA dehydrogenase [Actinobacteria bacterium ATB1]|nr:acyl-CoA dehydrogenase [Actinobacteria bacterium ATB1]
MDLDFTTQENDFRAEARSWLEANVPRTPLPSGDTREGFAAHLEWERLLFDARWAVVSWPVEYGGREATLMEWLVFEEEYYRAGAPNRVTQNGIFLLAPTIFEYGTQDQRDRLLPRMAAAEDLWCQGWSEPDVGSDLAGIKARATKVDGGWLLDGQKTWTTRGAFSTHLFGLFRSDPEAERHRGLTYFLVPLDAEGVTVTGVGRLDGDEGFAEVFFDSAFVSDESVLGGVGEGWKVAMSTTGSERGLTLRSPGRFMATATRLAELFRSRAGSADDVLRETGVKGWMDAQAYRLFTYQTVSDMVETGRPMGVESSLNKIFWSEMDVRLHETALALLGVDGELDEGSADAVDSGAWMKGWQFALAGPIYAGTNEIQRNVVAERVLGLPRK